MEQLTIFDLLHPGRIDPLREVAKHAGVYWTTSKGRLRSLYRERPTRETWREAVREEYSPYGYAGHYGDGDGPNSVHEWTFTSKGVKIGYTDEEGNRQEEKKSWADFAEKVAQLIEEGIY